MEPDSAGIDRPFICENCPKKYLRKNNLEDHVLMDHPDTKQASDIIAHKARNGRSKGSLIIECEICSKRFRYQSDLKNHFESHFRQPAKRGRVSSSVNGYPSTPSRHSGSTSPRAPPTQERQRTRPCVYCGKFFYDLENLFRHESAEAVEFEKETDKFENEKPSVTHGDFENRPKPNFHQVIDRTVEEFGEDYENGYEQCYYGRSPRSLDPYASVPMYSPPYHPSVPNGNVPFYESATIQNGGHVMYENSVHQPPQYVHVVPLQHQAQAPQILPSQYNNNHTSQYTHSDPAGYAYTNGYPQVTPPPAHEDMTTQHGFQPPPPALPIPEFTQVCHKRTDVEFPDPNEERTYTTLQSKDESHTSSLLHVNSTSPSREVLDLSMPKEGETPKIEVNEIDTNGHTEPLTNGDTPSEVVDSSVKPEVKNEDQVIEPKIEGHEETEDTEIVSFEPSSMPSMPEANIALQNMNGLTEQEWKEFEEFGMYEEDEFDPAPAVYDDPTRIDCKHCGMLFSDAHVRKFHEESHGDGDGEQDYDDGEMTRLFCGFCGKTFQKAKYRMLHEKSHTGDLPVTCTICSRQFRWESELRAHNKLFCTLEKPARPMNGNSRRSRHSEAKIRPRLVDQEGWIENCDTLPAGWRMRTRPRPAQEGQLYFIFMSPDNQVFHSRKAVMIHMEKVGTYSQFEFDRVRAGAKPGPRAKRGSRGRGGRGGPSGRLGRIDEKRIDLNSSVSNLDFENSMDSTMDKDKDSDSDDATEGPCTKWRPDDASLPKGWKIRAMENPSGKTVYQYLSPENTLFHSRKEILQFMKKDSHLFSQTDINKVGYEYKRKDTVETKKWVDLKIKSSFRKKVPKRKKLITNQVIVEQPLKVMRKTYIDNGEENFKGLSSEAFRFEPVIFVPRLGNIVKNMDIANILTSNTDDIQQKASIPINCVHTDEEISNNIDVLKEELKERQLDFESKHSDAEEEVDSGPSTPVRSLRHKTRLIYEEAPLEDEIDKKVYKQFLQNSKEIAEKEKAETEKRTPTIISLNPTKNATNSQNGSVHGDEEDDCFSDSFEEELLALKKNPREKMRFCPEDVVILDEWFEKSPYPDMKERKEIGKILMVPSKNVRVWFQNKRVKVKELGKSMCKSNYKKKPESSNYASSVEDEEDEAKYCKYCKQSFSTVWNLKIHNKRFHEGKECSSGSFGCRYCGKKYTTKWSMKTHVHEMHSRVTASIVDEEESVGTSEGLPEMKVTSLPDMDEYVASKKRFDQYQIKGLKNMFSWNKYPSKDEVLDLSRELNLTVKSITGWFTNQRHRDKIHTEARERLMSSPAMQRLQGSKVVKEKWLTNQSSGRANYRPMAWMDEKVPYNPGHKKTKFNDYQKAYLKNFFLQKQYVDEDDISELSAELQLSPKVLRIWFQHARERKKKNLPITSARARGKGRGRGRGRPPKPVFEYEKFDLDSDDEGLFNLDGDLEDDIPARPIVYASKSRGSGKANLSGAAFKWTEFQKVYLQDFYSEIQEPDADDMDYLCEHVNAPRQNISEWFETRNKERDYENRDSVLHSKEIISDLITNISESKNFTFVPPVDLSCQYCGMNFEDEYSLSAHEQIEAEEFEPEKYNTRILEGQDFMSMGSPEELSKYDDFNSEEEDFDELSYINNSSVYDEVVKNGFNGMKKKRKKNKEKPMDKRKIKRPLNPFMLWLKDERVKIKENKKEEKEEKDDKEEKKNPGDFLRDVSAKWKGLSEEEKRPYNEEALRLKEIHMKAHPEYYSNKLKANTLKPAGIRRNGTSNYEDISSDFKQKTVTTFKGYFCKSCKLGFYLKSSLFKHLKYYHPEVPLEPTKRHELHVGIIIGEDEPEGDMKVMKCDDCRSEFKTRSELSRHLYQHHQEMNNMAEPTSASVPSAKRSQFIDEEPVTFEAFRKYFDMEDEDPQDPQDFFDTSYSSYPAEPIVSSYSERVERVSHSQDYNGYDEPKKERKEGQGGTKTRFTDYQRGILMASFHKSIHMSKNDAKEMYEDLAESLDLPSKIVRIWFQNARSARKRGNPMYS